MSDGATGPSEHEQTRTEGSRIPLTQLKRGECGMIQGCDVSDDDQALLRAMGLRERAKIVVCRLGEPCIVRVMGGCGCSSRIGLSRPLAERVLVGPIEPR